MFTGIVEELGQVTAVESDDGSARLIVEASTVAGDVTHGASIAVNGVCLTVTDWTPSPSDPGALRLGFDVMAETLQRSALGSLRTGDRVNLERAATLTTRLGGHLVQGHVDGVGHVLERHSQEHWDLVRVSLPPEVAPYVVHKGSITVDGISLTVAAVDDTSFTVGLIPTTLTLTTLGFKGVGDAVNLEADVIAKHIEKLISHRTAGS